MAPKSLRVSAEIMLGHLHTDLLVGLLKSLLLVIVKLVDRAFNRLLVLLDRVEHMLQVRLLFLDTGWLSSAVVSAYPSISVMTLRLIFLRRDSYCFSSACSRAEHSFMLYLEKSKFESFLLKFLQGYSRKVTALTSSAPESSCALPPEHGRCVRRPGSPFRTFQSRAAASGCQGGWLIGAKASAA